MKDSVRLMFLSGRGDLELLVPRTMTILPNIEGRKREDGEMFLRRKPPSLKRCKQGRVLLDHGLRCYADKRVSKKVVCNGQVASIAWDGRV